MAVYAVSFDLEYDTTYQDRYTTFMEQVKRGGDWWADTTSFVAGEQAKLSTIFALEFGACLVSIAQKTFTW